MHNLSCCATLLASGASVVTGDTSKVRALVLLPCVVSGVLHH
jgi:hypothetical protein